MAGTAKSVKVTLTSVNSYGRPMWHSYSSSWLNQAKSMAQLLFNKHGVWVSGAIS